MVRLILAGKNQKAHAKDACAPVGDLRDSRLSQALAPSVIARKGVIFILASFPGGSRSRVHLPESFI